MDERLKRQLDFILELDKEKNVFRQTHLSGHGRRENDAEHAWHMAIMAYLLQEYSNERVDVAKVMLMCLIHDVVEIDAGDTYAYDREGLATQKARRRPQRSACTHCCLTIRSRRSARSSMNSKRTRPRRRILRTRWTISSRSCSTTRTAAATGRSMM